MVETSENIDTECQKIPYNQKVEQDLRQELSFTEVSNSKINKTFDIQIPELSLEAILMGSSEVMAQNIVDLFRVAMKDEMDISDTEQLVSQRRTFTHEELFLSLHPLPPYDIATAQESSNVRGNMQ
ncbi:hypothetical protein C1646_678040 [Rhizophagus diaphanus]|nr:hypothetical protein C1646_678040 [Rhizophagus diaphanus] [Rhizophagus sp. MUCL 43196]